MDKLNRQVVAMSLYNSDFPIILFWSHKSGCTSLAKWFFFQIGLLETAMEHSPWIHEYRAIYCYNQEYYNEVSSELASNKRDTYKLVRNPYARAVSSFLSFILATEFIHSLEGLKRSLETTGVSFKQYLYAVKKVGSSINAIDPHLSEQYVEGEEKVVDQYIHLEDFENEIRGLEKKHKLLSSPLEDLISSEHHNPHQEDRWKHSLADILFTSKLFYSDFYANFPTYSSFYDKETEHLVKEIFHMDFQTYGYSGLLTIKSE